MLDLIMQERIKQRQIELPKILAKGCKKHPTYRAIRKQRKDVNSVYMFGKP